MAQPGAQAEEGFADRVSTLSLTGCTRPHGPRRTGWSPGNPSEYLSVLCWVSDQGRLGGQWGLCGSWDFSAQMRPAGGPYPHPT